MTKFAAAVRRLMLSLFMIFLMIVCVLRLDGTSNLGAILYLVILGSIGIYLLFSLISIIVRLIKRIRMDEQTAMVSAFTDVLIFNKNANTINYFRRLAFWGTVMTIINIVAFNVSSDMLIGGPYATDLFLNKYHGFLLWSIISLVFLIIVSLIYFVVYLPHYGAGAYNIFQYSGKLFLADIATPFRVIKNLFSKDENGKRSFSQVFDFLTMLIFIIVNVIAVLASGEKGQFQAG